MKKLLFYIASIILIVIGGLTLGQLGASFLQNLTIVACIYISGILAKISTDF